MPTPCRETHACPSGSANAVETTDIGVGESINVDMDEFCQKQESDGTGYDDMISLKSGELPKDAKELGEEWCWKVPNLSWLRVSCTLRTWKVLCGGARIFV